MKVPVLGIVGHGAEKFTDGSKWIAIETIKNLIDLHQPECIVSGRSHLGGIDVWAEQVADELDIEKQIFEPTVRAWGAPGGYRDRNLQIAQTSDMVVCIVVRTLPRGYTGMRFDGCYHCGDRVKPHVKSGGCWTAWKCGQRAWRIL